MIDNPADTETGSQDKPMTRQELEKKIQGHHLSGLCPPRGHFCYSTAEILSAVDEYVAWVIGEDERHKDTSFGGSLTPFETGPMKHRNGLREEQRQRAGLEKK
jgi:hypothetical protein